MSSAPVDLAEENRVLRERVASLEDALEARADPFLNALIEHAPSFLNVLSLDGRFLATGRQSQSFGSVIGKSVFEFAEPESHAMMRRSFEEAAATGLPVVYESRGYGENGEPGHSYVVRVIPLSDGDRVTALMLVPTDITERVRLEQSLIESERAVRLAVEASHMGLWRWDISKNVIEWDARMREIFGVEETPAAYETYIQLVHHEDRELVSRVVREALETGVYRTFEHRLVSPPDSPERWILAAASVGLDASNKPAHIMGGTLDISEQKRLSTQRKRAERVESIGHLTAGIAHNFNNLLAAILPNLELALTSASESDNPPLKAALDASLQARDLIKSLLALAGRRGARPEEPSDPIDIARRVESICRMTFPRELDLKATVDAGFGLVAMPATDLEQVLLNLLFNARDAVELAPGPARRIELVMDGTSGNDGARFVRIRVIDTGIGMTAEVRGRVFDPFFTTKPPHRGSGLGLSNALARVRESQGRLECESRPGSGTTFTVLLPELPRPTRSSSPVSAPPSDGRGETILVVDDEPLVRSVVRRILESQTYEVLQASSADEAREVLERAGARVALVILDHSMPKESGLEALDSLRARTAAPIVLFTGLAPDVPSGIAAVLDKPARPAELTRVVRDVLDGRLPLPRGG